CNGLEAPGPPSSTSLFALSHSFPIQFLKVFEAQQPNRQPNRTGLIARAEAQESQGMTRNSGNHAGVTDNYSPAGCQGSISAGIYLIVRAAAQPNNCGNTSLFKAFDFSNGPPRPNPPAPGLPYL